MTLEIMPWRIALTRAEWRALRAAATPGLWRVGRKVGRTLYAHATGDGDGELMGVVDSKADAALIAAEHNALPAIVDALDRAKAALEHIALDASDLERCRSIAARTLAHIREVAP